MAGKGGGAWKVAYADFVTAMMAFFMVMWLTSQSEAVRESIAKHFREPPGIYDFDGRHTGHGNKERGHKLGPRAPKFTPPPVELQDAPQSSVPRILIIHDQDRQHVGTILVFPDESAELTDLSQEQLRQIAVLAAGKPQRLEIRGHASRKPLAGNSAFQDPWQLSYARCTAVMKFLEELGISRERLRLSQAGPGEPFAVLPDSQHVTYDSRVEVFLLAEFAEENRVGGGASE
jgi:chemotaxis protein MotB